MTAPYPRAGEAVALQLRHIGSTGIGTLYASLTYGGARPDTMLLESPGGRSIALDQAALRITCRGQEVELAALSIGGRLLLRSIVQDLEQYVVVGGGGSALLRFPRISSEDAEERLTAPSPFDALRSALFRIRSKSPEQPLTLFAGGVISFDHVDLFEDLPPPSADPLGFPDYIFWVAESLIVTEPGGATTIICTAFGSDDDGEAAASFHSARERLERLTDVVRSNPRNDAEPITPILPTGETTVEVDLPDPVFAGVVTALKSAIARGDIFQVVPSRTFRTPCADSFAAYRALRRTDESPYHFFIADEGHRLFGASPETSVRVQDRKGRLWVEVKPIAGTRRRGRDGDEDNRLEAELRLDEKEVAEHMMLIDLARNDVARVSAAGTRHVARLLTVERYARVMHLVSSVEGQLQPGYDALHAAQACLNVGTLSGAPKIKATELIRLVEGSKRGPYGGAVGWIAGNGELETAVVIRSAIVTDGVAHVRAGAGVVHDSDPLAEADETRRKAAAVLSAIRSTEMAA